MVGLVYGGLVRGRVAKPREVTRLAVPQGMTAVVVDPDLEIETSRARALLGDTVPLADAVQQWANLGAFVDALHRGDFAQLARSLQDTIAEPRRASLVPGLAAIKRAAADAGALGCSLSGSGPSLFALSENNAIPLVEIEPNIYALELFHGPTLAFKDVGARIMARVMASLHLDDDPLTVLAATSGDTGSAVAHAFHRVPHTRVVVLYPDGRISPTQEAQLTMFNGERTNVRAYAVAGSFDDCHRLTRQAFGDAHLRTETRLTSANSVNVGRLLPQSIYYFHAIAQLQARTDRSAVASDTAGQRAGPVFSTPSGNFGNLTAGLMAKRAGLPVARFVAATNVNDVVPQYLATGRFEPRPSQATIANAMDVGHPSNFDRMSWIYGGDLNAMRHDIDGTHFTDDDVRATIRRVYDERGHVLA